MLKSVFHYAFLLLLTTLQLSRFPAEVSAAPWWQVRFTDGNNSTTDTTIRDSIVSIINASTESVYLANYSTPGAPNAITTALNNRAAVLPPAAVRYVGDDDYNCYPGLDPSIPCVIDAPGSPTMHNKFLIRDPNSAVQRLLIMGSGNYTNGGWGTQDNSWLFINSTGVIQNYLNEFLEMYNGTFHGGSPTTPNPVVINGSTKAYTLFSCEDRPFATGGKVDEIISQAQESIFFGFTRYNQSDSANFDLHNSIISRLNANPGLLLEGVVWSMGGPNYSNFGGQTKTDFDSRGVEVRQISVQGIDKHHQKYEIIDMDWVGVGSVNASIQSSESPCPGGNDENHLFVNDFRLARAFMREFHRHYHIDPVIGSKDNTAVTPTRPHDSTGDDIAPGAPTNLSVRVNSSLTQFIVNWTPPAVNPGDFSRYYIYISTAYSTLASMNAARTEVTEADGSFRSSDLKPEVQVKGYSSTFAVVSTFNEDDPLPLLTSAQYFIGVSAVDIWGNESPLLFGGPFPEIIPPAAISDLTALPGPLEGQIRLQWTAPGDDGTIGTCTGCTYEIKWSSITNIHSLNYSTGPITSSTTLSGITITPGVANFYTVGNLVPGVTYWFAIKTIDDSGNISVWNSTRDVLTVNTSAYNFALDLQPPIISTPLVVARGANWVFLSWTKPAVDVSSYTIYFDTWNVNGNAGEVYRGTYSLSPPAWSTAPITVINSAQTVFYLVSGLAENTTYFFAIRSGDESPGGSSIFVSSYSANDSTVTLFGLPPPATGFIGVALSTISIRWSWSDPTNAETLYQVKFGSNPAVSVSSALNANTTFWIETSSVASLTPNTSHYRVVVASNSFGEGLPSNGATVYTLANPPTGFMVIGLSPTSMVLRWQANNNPPWTQYALSQSTDNFTVNISTIFNFGSNLTSTTITLGGLSQNTTYFFRLWAINGDGIETDFNATGVAYSTTTRPITFFVTNLTSGSFVLGRTTSSILWGWTLMPNATGYQVKYGLDPTVNISSDLASGATTFLETNLGVNQPFYRLVAGKIALNDQLSNIATAYTLAQPPANLQFTQVFQTTITIAWNANGNPVGTRYGVAITTDATFLTSTTVRNFSSAYTALTDFIGGLQPQTTYYVRVWAFNGDGIITNFVEASTVTKRMGVFISEFSFDGTNDWIELYNDNDFTMNIASWSLQLRDVNGAVSTITFTGAALMPAKSFYLIVNAGASASGLTNLADLLTPLDLTNNGTIVLSTAVVNTDLIPAGSASVMPVVDRVAWSDVIPATPTVRAEGSAIVSAGDTFTSYERKAFDFSASSDMAPGGLHYLLPNIYDSENNNFDFVKHNASYRFSDVPGQPQNSANRFDQAIATPVAPAPPLADVTRPSVGWWSVRFTDGRQDAVGEAGYLADFAVIDAVENFVRAASHSVSVANFQIPCSSETPPENRLSLALNERGANLPAGTVRYIGDRDGDNLRSPPVGTYPNLNATVLQRIEPEASFYTPSMYNNFIVRDTTDPARGAVLVGSFYLTPLNWSWRDNSFLFIYSTNVALNYQNEFEEMWNGTWQGGTATSPNPVLMNGASVYTLFACEDTPFAPGSIVYNTIRNANESVFFQTNEHDPRNLGGLSIDNAILSHYSTMGFLVEGVVNSMGPKTLARYNAKGWKIRQSAVTSVSPSCGISRASGKHHHNHFIVDLDWVGVGSVQPQENESEGNCPDHDGNFVFISDFRLARAYMKEFHRKYHLDPVVGSVDNPGPDNSPGFRAHDDIPPPAPANLSVISYVSSFTVNWTPPAVPGDDFSRYYIFISTRFTTATEMIANWTEIAEPDGSYRSAEFKPEVQVKGVNSSSGTVRTINENVPLVPNSRGYYIAVVSVDKWGNESEPLFGGPFNLQPDPIPPAAVSDLVAVIATGIEGGARLTWTSPGDDENSGNIVNGIYEIRYSSVQIINSADWSGSCPNNTIPYWQRCLQIVSTNIVPGQLVGTLLTGLQSDTSYWFAIKTQDEGEGNFSLWNSSANVPTVNTSAYSITGDTNPPQVLTPFIIGTAPGWIYLSWTKPTSDVEIYEIHYSTSELWNSTGTFVFPGTSTVHVPSISPVTALTAKPREPNTVEFFVLTGLMDQTTYYISIRARDFGPNVFLSTFSVRQSTRTQLGPVIPPTNFAGVALSTSSIYWRWDDNSEMEQRYLLKYASSGVIIAGGDLPANTTEFTETNLLPNTSAFRVVVGSNAIGEGFPSAAVLRWTLARPPTGFTVTEIQPDRVRLIWEANENPPHTRYALSRSTNENFAAPVSTFVNFGSNLTATVHIATGLTPFTTYYFRVWAFNEDQIATTFEQLTTTTTPNVTLVVASKTTTSIHWAWNPLIPTATGYQLKYSLDLNVNITTPLAQGTTNFLESGLSVNSVYRRVLAGQTPFGTNLSNSVTVYTLAHPPTNLRWTGVFQTTISFAWDANGNPGGTRYGAAISTWSDFSQAVSTFISFASGHTALSAARDGLIPKTTYFIRVWAFNGDGVETSSIELSTVTKDFGLLISEFSFGSSASGNGPFDDWIELYNNNDFALNLAGWALQLKSSTGTFTKVDLTGVIPAKGFYLVVRDASGTNQGLKNIATQLSTGLVLASDNGTIFITTDTVLLNTDTQAGNTVLDRVGWSNVIPASGTVAAEGTAINSFDGEGYSYERKASSSSTNFTMAPGGSDNTLPNTYDSNNNQFDFVRHAISYRIPGIPGNPEGVSDLLIPPPPAPATSGAWWSARFTDGNSTTFDTAIENEIESFVLEAKNKVYVANYSVPLASTKLTNAMNNRALAGVEVRYVGDGTEGAYPNLNSSVGVRLDPAGGQIMHNKFILRDPDSETNRALLMGSGNFTPGGWGTQDNSFLIIRSSVIIQKYLEEFNEMWSGTFQGGTATTGLPLTVNGRNVYTLFGCEDRPFAFGNPVDVTIRAASESIFFETSGHDPANQGNLHLDDAILSRRTVANFKLIEGVYNTMGQATLDRYNSTADPLKVEIRQSAQTALSKHHHKYIVIDMDWLGVGSVNPSKSSSENSCPDGSDENFLLVNDFRLARAYMKEFHRHYHIDAVKGSADNTAVTPTRPHDDSPPPAPANLSVSALASSFTVSWSAPSDPGDFSRYYVYITTKSQYTTASAMDSGRSEIVEIDGSFRSSELKPEVQVKNISVTTVTITTFNEDFPLPPGSTGYYIGVAAVDLWGNESSLLFGGPYNLIADLIAPGAISNLTALSGTNEGEIRLQWTAPGNNGNSGFITPGTYEIKFSSVGIITRTNYDSPPVPSSSTQFVFDITPGLETQVTITGLLPNTSYWFAIKTRDESGNLSVWNSSADVATINTLAYAEARELPPPAPATPFVISRGANWVLLSWSKPAMDVDSYQIHYATWNVNPTSATLGLQTYNGTSTVAGMNSPITFASTNLNPVFLLSGLNTGVTYYFSLRALDAPPTILISSHSVNDSTFPASGLPPAATGFSGVAISSSQIIWSWNDVSDAETNYRVKYVTSGVSASGDLAQNTTFWEQTGLTANSSHFFNVVGVNSFGEGPVSASVLKWTLARPPTGFRFIEVQPTSMKLTWQSNENPAHTRYGMSRSTDNFTVNITTFFNFASAITSNTVTVGGLSPETTYFFRVWAMNGNGAETNFEVTYTTTTPNLVLSLVSRSTNSLTWSWSPLIPGATGYRLKYALDTNVNISTELAGNVTSYLETNLNVNEPHYRKVAALTNFGDNHSNSVTAYTLARAPANLTFTNVYDNTIRFEWDANGNPLGTQYGISLSTDNFTVNVSTIKFFGSHQTQLNYIAQGLNQLTTYYFRVWAFNGEGIASEFISASTVTKRTSVFISEFSHGRIGTIENPAHENEDWVELFNDNDFDVRIDSWSLQVKNAVTGTFTKHDIKGVIQSSGTITNAGVIPAKSFYLIVFGGAIDTQLRSLADEITASTMSLPSRKNETDATIFIVTNTILLTSLTETGPSVVDRVGYTDMIPAHAGVVPEGSAIISAEVGSWLSYERKAFENSVSSDMAPGGFHEFAANRYDSQNNFFDFVWHSQNYRIPGIPGLPQNSKNRFDQYHTTSVPQAPANFRGVAQSTDSIRWSWTDVTDETFYFLKFASNPAVNASPVIPVNTTNYLETGLSPNTSHFRLVVSANPNGTSPVSNSTVVFTLAQTPANLTLSGVTISSLTLSWNANGNPSYTRYGLSRSTDNFTVNISTFVNFDSTQTATTLGVTNLLPATTYYFRVWAYNGDKIESSFIAIATKTKAIALSGVATGTGTIVWSWVLPVGSTDTAVSLTLRNGSDPSIVIAGGLATGSTWYQETNLAINQEYFRILTAEDGASNQIFATHLTRLYTLAQVPSSFTFTGIFVTTLTFSWNANSNPAGTRYGVSFSTDNFTVNISSPIVFESTHTALSASLSGLSPNTTYYLRLWAYNGNRIETVFLSSSAQTRSELPILISEFSFNSKTDGSGGTEDWVELFNPNSFPVNLAEWSLQRKDASNNYFKLNLTGVIPTSGYYLIVDADSTNTELKNLADQLWTDLNLADAHQTIFLVRNQNLLTSETETSNQIADRVGYSNAIPPDASVVPEGTALNSNSGAGRSFERKVSSNSTEITLRPGGVEDFLANSYDSNNNADDFVQHTGIYRIAGIPGLPQNSKNRFHLPFSTSVPPVPSNFTGTAVSTSSIVWGWSDVIGESFYVVKLATNSSIDISTTIAVNTTNFLETNLLPNRQYMRVVVSSNTNGSSTLSNAATIYTLARLPASPVFSGVTISSLTLSWSANENPAGTKYGVSRSTIGFAVGLTTFYQFNSNLFNTQVEFVNLVPETTYYFNLWSYNGDGLPTDAVQVSTRTLPVIFRGTATSPNSITWSWSLPPGTTVAGDTLLLKHGSDSSIAISTPLAEGTSFYLETGLNVNQEYNRILVASRPAVGEIFATHPLKRYTLSRPPTDFLFDEVFTTTITISWSANGNPNGTRYGVSLSTISFDIGISTLFDFNSAWTAVRENSQQTKLVGLSPSTTYYIRVWSYNGNVIESALIQASTRTRPLSPVVISEFSFDSSTTTAGDLDDWVELYNPNPFPVSIQGWSLQRKDALGNYFKLDLNGSIPASGYFLIVRDAAGTNSTLKNLADALWTNLDLASDHQTLFLVRNNILLDSVTETGAQIADRVGYSNLIPPHSSAVPEGTALNSSSGQGKSFERKASSSSTNLTLQPGGSEEFQPNSYDTQDNSNDFVQHQNPFRILGIPGNPQNSIDRHFTPIIFTAPPLAPAGFSGVALGVSSISWSWNDVLFESSYTVRNATGNTILSGFLPAETSSWIETGLAINTSYFRYVTAGNQAGTSPNSNSVLIYTLANPPTNFKTVSVGPDRILVEWTANHNPPGTRYGLSHSTDNFVVNITTVVDFASGLLDTSYLFTGLTQFTTYYLRLWAYNGQGRETDFVVLSTVTELVVLRGTATSVSSINWSWQLIPGSTDTAVLLQLKSGNDLSILIANLGTGVTFYQETGLSTNQEYFRILTAVDGTGAQVFASNVARRYTAAQVPANFSVTSVFTTTVSFSWNANGNPAGTRYGASFSTNSNFAVPVSTFLDFNSNHTALTASVGNLNPNTDYYFRVWAYNGDGIASAVVSTSAKTDPLLAVLFSEFSYDSDSAVGGETNDWVELYNPNNLSINLSGWSLQRKDASGNYFKRDLSGVIPASGYYLIVDNEATNSELRNLANELWTDLNLADDHQTLFLVNTTNLLTSLTETGTSVIDRVGYSNLIPAHSQVTPEGTAINSNGGAGKSFERKASSSSTNLTMQPGGSQEFLPNSYDSNNNADDFVTHTNAFRILGIPGLPQNANDKHFTPIIFSTPATPANFGGTALGVSSISWSWNDVLGESFYKVRVATNPATILSGNLPAETTHWIETGLTPNTSYQRVVNAGNSSGESGVSNSSLTFTLAQTPTNFALISVSPTTILVQWNSNGNPNYTRYGLSRSTDNFDLNVTTVVNFAGGLTDTSYQFTGLAQSTTYQLRVWAYNQEQKESSYVTISTRTQTITFTGTAISTNSIRWNWLPVSGANNYRVKYGLDPAVTISSFLASGTTYWDERNLEVNRDYYRVVVASNVNGEFFTSNIERIYTLAMPPTGFTLTGVFDSTITFKWSANGNPPGTRYGAAYSTNPAFSVAVTTFLNFASQHTALNSSVEGLAPATTYYFRIWAYNGDGIEAIPPVFSTVTMPSAMVLLSEFSFNSSTDASGEFNDWVELYNPNSFSVNLAQWSLQRKDSSGNFFKKNLVGVIPAKSFYLIVRDAAATNTTLKTIADELWTDLALPGDHQTIFLVSNQVLLTTATQTGLSVVDRVGYSSIIPAQTQVVPEGTALVSQFNEGKSFERKAFESSVSTNMQPGGAHEFSENRYDSNNNSFDFVTHAGDFRITGIPGLPQNSANRFDQLIATSVPNPVQNFKGIAKSTSSIEWNWEDVLGEGLYRVKLATNPAHAVSPNLVADTTFWLETNLKANSTYFRVVAASNTLGEGNPSNSALVFTLARTPTNFRLVEVFATSVTLSWNENLNPNWTRFGLSRSSWSDFSQAVSTFVNFATNLTTTAVTAVNLLPSTTYYFRLWAYNGDQIETVFLTLSTKTAPGIIPKVVISEFSHDSIAGSGGEQEDWIELYNPTSIDINLNGWSLQTKDVFNVFRSTPLKGIIPANGFYLIVGSSASAPLKLLADIVWKDLVLPNDFQTIYVSNENNLLTTLTETGFSIVDRVAYSTSFPSHPNVTPEGTALVAQEGASFERKANANSTSLSMRPGGSEELSGNSYDSNNNANDFVVHIFPYRIENIPGQPQNSKNIDSSPVDMVKPQISHTPLTTRQLFRTPILIDVQVMDGKISDFDGLGSIVTIRGQVRKPGKPETAVWMEFFPPPDGAPTYIGQADITVLVQNPSEGIEYFIEAVDSGMNVKRFPNPTPEEWYLVKPQTEGRPEQKVLTPSNPEVVFGQEVEEAVIRDTNGNLIWRGSSDGSSVVVWKGTDNSGQSLEVGPYIYEIKTKGGAKKYGVVVIIK